MNISNFVISFRYCWFNQGVKYFWFRLFAQYAVNGNLAHIKKLEKFNHKILNQPMFGNQFIISCIVKYSY